jgi:hypothetical protein
MAGVPVTIRGRMYRTGLHVGGGPMPGGPRPEHPIAPGGPGESPPGIWGGVPPEYVDIGGPADQPGIWGGANEGFPTHPIVIPPGFLDDVKPEHPIVIPPPTQPPGIWGGGNEPFPTPPIFIPPDLGIWGPNDPRPTHPIVLPPPTVTYPPQPTHPIVLPPPGEEGPPEVLQNWDVVAYWTPSSGWGVAIVPTESHPGVPTPSGSSRSRLGATGATGGNTGSTGQTGPTG